MHQIRFSLGLRPKLGSPEPYTWLKGPTSKGRGGLFAADVTRGAATQMFAPGGKNPLVDTAAVFRPSISPE